MKLRKQREKYALFQASSAK